MNNTFRIALLTFLGLVIPNVHSQNISDYFPQDNASSSSDVNALGQFVNEKPELLSVGNDDDLKLRGNYYLKMDNDGSGEGTQSSITVALLPGEYTIGGYFRKTNWTHVGLSFAYGGEWISIGIHSEEQDRTNEWIYDEATFTVDRAANITFHIGFNVSSSASIGHLAYFDGLSLTKVDDKPSSVYDNLWNSSGEDINYVVGNVSIGTASVPIDDGTPYKLAVKGKIIAEEIKVQLNSQWPDYVFNDAYDLPSLEEIEEHIKMEGHLINIPSAEEVKANGVSLGEMNSLLLEKIEELTIHLIQVKKELDELKAK